MKTDKEKFKNNYNSSNYIPRVIDLVVKNDLCIGCGMCTYSCESNVLQMQWNEFGFLTPIEVNHCTNDHACISVCPFNPYPEQEVKTENELAEMFLENATSFHPKVGKYNNFYTGFSNFWGDLVFDFATFFARLKRSQTPS